MAVAVNASDEYEAWFLGLDDGDGFAVARMVDILGERGLALGHPYSSAIVGATFALRELRIQSGGRPIRVFYAFDPERDAYLLIGGDKTGRDRFYEEMIPLATKIWEQYLSERNQGASNKGK